MPDGYCPPVPTAVPTPVPTPIPTLVPTPVPTFVPTPVPTPVPVLSLSRFQFRAYCSSTVHFNVYVVMFKYERQ